MSKILIVIFFLIFSKSVFADDKMTLGLNVYKEKAQCGVCHTLKAAKSDGEIGPNLDQLKPKISEVINVVTNGIGVMPPWEGILTSEEIDAGAHYVSTVSQQ